MRIAGVASAFPEHYYKQELLVEALKNDWRHRLPNPDILDRLDESMQVDGRFLVETIDYYENLKTWGQANDTWIRARPGLGRKIFVSRAGASRARAARPERDFCDVGHRHRGAVARCAARESHGTLAEYQANSNFRTWMRRRRRRNFARCGLRATAYPDQAAALAFRGIVLPDAAARRPLDGASDFRASFRRRSCGHDRGRLGNRIERTRNSRHEIQSCTRTPRE